MMLKSVDDAVFKEMCVPAGTKTTLPSDPAILGVAQFCRSHAIEIIPEMCPSCSRYLGGLSYEFSLRLVSTRSNRPLMFERYTSFANEHQLQMCCRSALISPLIMYVVSTDIGARRVETENGNISIQDHPA
jgi:hypothetical protein